MEWDGKVASARFACGVSGRPLGPGEVFFSGLAPGFAGLYQINFYVPQDVAAGNLPIYIQTPYANSPVVILPVR